MAIAYFEQYPDVAASYTQNNYGLTPEQYAQAHYQNYGVNERRISPQVAEVNAAGAASMGATSTPTYTPVAAAYFQQNPDVAQAYRENTYGLTPDQFASTHYQLYGGTEQRAAPAGAATGATTTANTGASLPYFQRNPDVAASYLVNNYGMTPEQFAAAHYARYGQAEQRAAPGGTTVTGTGTVTGAGTGTVTGTGTGTGTGATARTGTTTGTTTGTGTTGTGTAARSGAALPYFQLNPDVAASYLTNNYGMTPEQFAAAHYARYGQFEQRVAPTTSPFANATSGFDQNFRNYTSIPIGAQYNPNVVGGTGSPYSQIMGQMRPNTPAFNPYMGVASNTPMGGYDPGLYDRIAEANAVASLAAGTAIPFDGGGINETSRKSSGCDVFQNTQHIHCK